MNKLTTILISAGIVAVSGTVSAEGGLTATFGDPQEGGIGYEWTVKGAYGEVELLGSVGGKSAWEPKFELPDKGWTHTSDWVALQLDEKVRLEVTVKRQAGFYEMKVDKDDPTKITYSTAGSELYPTLSVYEGWDSTTEKEKGSFNPAGNFWSTIVFKDVVYSAFGEDSVRYVTELPAGQYTLNFGGVNDLYCNKDEPCGKGKHGYRAVIKASMMKMK